MNLLTFPARNAVRFLLLLLVVVLAGTVFSSCEARKQAAADAGAGAEALANMLTDLDPAAADDANAIAAGVASNAAAAAGSDGSDLPKPSRSPDQIRRDPDGYKKEGDQRRQESGWGTVAGWGAAGLALVAGVIRATGAGGPLAGILATLLEGAAVKRRKEEVAHRVGALEVIIKTIDAAPEDTKPADLKKLISKALSPDQEAEVRRLIQQLPTLPSTSQ